MAATGLFGVRDDAFADELLQFGADDELAVSLVRMLVVIVLVILLGRIKVGQRNDLRHNGRGEMRGGFGLGFFGRLFLRVAAVENNRTVLRADVVALAVEGGRIVGFPENFQQFFVRNDGRIELDLNHFGMAGIAGANVFVTGIGRRAAGKTGDDGFDSGNALKDRLGAPKTAAAKGRGLEFCGRIGGNRISIHKRHEAKTAGQHGHPKRRDQGDPARLDLLSSHNKTCLPKRVKVARRIFGRRPEKSTGQRHLLLYVFPGNRQTWVKMKHKILEVCVCCLAFVLAANAQTPVITSQPQSITINNASTANFSVTATNAAGYQWQFDGTSIAGATNSALLLDDVNSNQAGSYTVVVTSSGGVSVTNGTPAVLALVPGTIVQLTISRYANGNSSNIVVQLFDHDKPATVANFIHYITSGAYSNMFFDRCPGNPAVLQGGTYDAVDRTNTPPGVNAGQIYDLYVASFEESPT